MNRRSAAGINGGSREIARARVDTSNGLVDDSRTFHESRNTNLVGRASARATLYLKRDERIERRMLEL